MPMSESRSIAVVSRGDGASVGQPSGWLTAARCSGVHSAATAAGRTNGARGLPGHACDDRAGRACGSRLLRPTRARSSTASFGRRRSSPSPSSSSSGIRSSTRRPRDHANVDSIAKRRFWRHNGAMPSVQIKDVPDETHAVLRRRAAAAHQSLQEYLRARLIEDASQPTLDEVLDRAGGRSGGRVPLKTAVAAIRDDRDRR
jgi:plasmid stability protein